MALLPMCSGIVGALPQSWRSSSESPLRGPGLLLCHRKRQGSCSVLQSGTSWLSGWMCGTLCGGSQLEWPQTGVYSTFMRNLSACIFRMGCFRCERLKEAKHSTGCQPTAKSLRDIAAAAPEGLKRLSSSLGSCLRTSEGPQTPWASSFWTRRGCRDLGIPSSTHSRHPGPSRCTVVQEVRAGD